MISLRKLLWISRPRFWLYTAGPFLLGFVAGLPDGYRQMYPPLFWLLFFYFLIPANVFLYGINDIFDEASDKVNEKKETKEYRLQSGERRFLFVVLAFIVIMTVALLPLIPSKWQPLVWLFLFFATFYSAPPLRYKARPIFDSYSNLLYVVPGFLGYALTSGTLPPSPMIMGAICWAAGMHAYSAIPDIEPDTAAGVKTVAVFLGKPRTLLFVAINWVFFAVLTVTTIGPLGLLAFLYPAIPLLLYFRPTIDVKRVYWWFPVLNVLMGFLVFVYKTL